MADQTATERRSHLLSAVSHGGAYEVINLTSTIEFAAGATGRTINFGHIPSNARLQGSCRLYYDDMSNAGAPTLDIGIGAVNGNLANADDVDAIGNGFTLATAANDKVMISDIANFGLPAWDLVASETSDPGGELKVYGTLLDAATTVVGTITAEMYYVVD
jgi:hypothetical protein